jgi:hypothetical protein
MLTKASDRHNYRVLEGATAATCFAAIVTYLEDYSQSQLGVFIMGNSKRNVSEEDAQNKLRRRGSSEIGSLQSSWASSRAAPNPRDVRCIFQNSMIVH